MPHPNRYPMDKFKPADFKLICLLGLSCIAGHAYAGQLSVLVTSQADVPLENAVVYAEPVNKISMPAPDAAAIEQKNKKFLPLVTVAQTGASITFPNHDTVRHHVYSFSPAKTFELKLYSGVPSTPVIFDKAGTVVLGCNIHDQMLAFVQIVDTPYFGKTDAEGKVKILNIPNGQYTLKVWHYALVKENVPLEQSIAVKGNDQFIVKIDIKNSDLR